MSPVLPSPFGRLRCLLAAAFVLAAGCGAAETSANLLPPPPAEFVLAAGDSAYWITSAGGTVRIRGAPLELARVDGRFYELYVTDDDRSYEDALFVGQRVYRRDLLRGDSVLVYQDSIVPQLARLYARTHPDDTPVRAPDEPPDDPRWTATASLELTEVQGPYVSFSLHTDVQRDDSPSWHTSRRGVIDIRGSGAVNLAAIAGPNAPQVERQRARAFTSALDSLRATDGAGGARAASVLPHYRLDPLSFALTTDDGAPAIAYAVPGMGDGDAGLMLPLAPIRIDEPVWWSDVAAGLPVGSANGARDVWRHGRYEVVVHYDSAAGAGRLALRDSTSREWTIGRVGGQATRIYWLDTPVIDAASRQALARAFEESTLYDESVRTASHRRTSAPRVVNAGNRRAGREMTHGRVRVRGPRAS